VKESLFLLGTGTAVPTLERGPTAELLVCGPDVTLIDPGPGAVQRAARAGFAPHAIDRVLLTHHHPDHCLDLVALLFARVNPFLDPPTPLRELEVIGGPGTHPFVTKLVAVFGHGLLEGGGGVRITERIGGEFALGATLRAVAFPITHSTASVAYRITLPSGVILAVSGDTGDDENAVAVARAADHYLLEAALPEDRRIGAHLTAREAGRIAARAGCEHLILNHFYPQVDPHAAAHAAAESFRGRITIGCDGMEIPLGRAEAVG
jgi:ribonuclease BN (tRNA processing enzyme)